MYQSSHTPQRWTTDLIDDQSGRTVLITGANSGIGFEAANVLAKRGATVVLACRDLPKAEHAAHRITARTPHGRVETLQLDLASLASIRDGAGAFRSRHERLDVLINNAGVMFTPFGLTADGFEQQFGINHLGHFALTGLVIDRLLATPGSRIVTVSSNGHKQASQLYFDDLQWERRTYSARQAYMQSKLANLLFTYELQSRLAAVGAAPIALAGHPGAVRTNLVRYSPFYVRAVVSKPLTPFFSWLMQNPGKGALTTLRAATDPDARGGDYFGPDGRGEWTGYPTHVKPSEVALDQDAQCDLWEHSERLTGIEYLPKDPTASNHGRPSAPANGGGSGIGGRTPDQGTSRGVNDWPDGNRR